MRRAAPLLALALLLALCACTRRSQGESGVVARVNGWAITLDMLEFQYDQLHFDALGGSTPSVSSLREAYGDILGQLIAQELVAQELEKRGQEVSGEELAKAEGEIRGDYGGEAFDQMLADEYIDLRQWRRQLKALLGVEKFQRLVLRPSIRLDYREVEAYYREHLDDFRLPERLRLLVVRGPDRPGVDKALVLYRQRQGTENLVAALAAALPEVQAREIVLARALMSPAWADALHGDSGRAGAILQGRGGFEGVLLLERLPAQTQDIAQAYQQVEAALLERRLQEAFEAWLAKAVDASVIRVSGRLLRQAPDEDLPPDPGEDKAQQDVASGNETR